VPAADLLEAGSGTVATLLNNGQVLAVGLTTGASPQPDAEVYSPSFNPSGFVILESADSTQPTISGCHLALVSNSALASTCGLPLPATSLATTPDVIPADAALFGTPDGVHLTSKGMANLTLTPAATTTAIASSSNPSGFGQPVTFTATVTDSSPGSA